MPCPAPAAPPPRSPASSARDPPPAALRLAARLTPLRGRAGRRGRGPGGLEGPNRVGCFGFAPLFSKSKSRNADRGAVRLRPGLTSLAPSAGSSDVRFPVRLVPDPVTSRQHWLRQLRVTLGTPSPRRAPAACGSPSGVSAGLSEERARRGRRGSSRAGRPRAHLRRAADRPPRSRSFHHALAARLFSGVFPAGRRTAPRSARGAHRRRRLRVGTRLFLGRGARRGRGQGGCGSRALGRGARSLWGSGG